MANTLTQIGIETGNIVEAYHVSQSIDAFTGAVAYDITLSGSFDMTGPINGEPGLINPLTASYAITASHAISSSFATSASYAVSASYVLSSSYALSSSYSLSSSFSTSASRATTASFVTPLNQSVIITGSLSVVNLTSAKTSKLLFYNNSTGQISSNDSSSLFDDRSYFTTQTINTTTPFIITHNLNNVGIDVLIHDQLTFPLSYPYAVYSQGVDYTYEIQSLNSITITPIGSFGGGLDYTVKVKIF